MLKAIVVFLSFLMVNAAMAQTDTLYFAGNRYPLKKVKKNYSVFQGQIPYIPVEYSEYKNVRRQTYMSTDDSSYVFETDDDGSRFMVTKPETPGPPKETAIFLGSFLDTIKIKAEELHRLKIYISGKGKRVYFSAFHMLNYKNGWMKDFSAGYIADGDLFASFDFFNSGYREHQLKNSTCFITHLYYQRNGVNYFLDRNFIIVCE
jgi:hypothetical protein